MRLQDVIESAKSELMQEIVHDELSFDDACDRVHEISDSNVPVYHGELIQLAQDDMTLMLEEPELGPAFDGSSTAINVLAAVVYERICQEVGEIAPMAEGYETAREELESYLSDAEENWAEKKEEVSEEGGDEDLAFTEFSDLAHEFASELAREHVPDLEGAHEALNSKVLDFFSNFSQ
jgi:hypothetical protein